MDFDFDDGLSEDWISQPRSSRTPSVKDDSMLSQQTTNKAPQSRIPRPKSAFDFSERKKLQPAAAAHTPTRCPSSQSLSSVTQDTVQLRNPNKQSPSGQKAATPEWKKRILQNNKGRNERTDLFSPTGLEQAFQPPTDPRAVSKLVRRSAAPIAAPKASPLHDVFPSSPPMIPNQKGYTVNILDDKEKEASQEDLEVPPVTAYRWDSEDSEDISLPPAQIQRPNLADHDDHADHAEKEQCSSAAKKRAILPEDLHSKLQNLGIKDRKGPPSPFSDSEIAYDQGRRSFRGVSGLGSGQPNTSALSAQMPNISDNAFITIKRGGNSTDESFLNRSLSDPSMNNSSLPTAPTPPAPPKVSDMKQHDEQPSTPPRVLPDLRQSRASGSPLKLFDKHDTFTHRCLNRRISQYEGRSPISSDLGTIDARKTKSSPPPRVTPEITARTDQNHRRMSNFGAGQLDEFGFDHRQPSKLLNSSPATNDEDQENQPPLPQLDRNSQTRFRSQKANRTVLRERRPNVEHLANQSTEQSELGEEASKLDQTHQAFNDEGKRIPSSPHKRRESKRRRTSHIVVGATQVALFDDRKSPNTSAKSLAGKKRKDARYDNSNQAADPKVIAARHRLQPRKSHSMSRSMSAQQVSMSFTGEPGSSIKPVDVTMEALADQLASFAHGVAESVVHGRRKNSVTTADYFKEANMIMQNIRAQAVSNSGYKNTASPELDQLSNLEGSFDDEYTLEEFSRPASREGTRSRKPRQPKPLDPRVLSHLRKYDETNEQSDLELPEHRESSRLSNDASYRNESDPPNIRIHDSVDSGLGMKSPQRRVDSGNQSNNSQNGKTSRSEESGRSVPTTSTSSTGRPKVILPDTVSHILGETVGRMTFDAKLQRWVKRKTSKISVDDSNVHDSEITEDDPFREIPDLAVDESQEMRNSQADAGGSRPSTGNSAKTFISQPSENDGQERPKSSSTTGPSDTESSAVTKNSRFASSGPAIETRATSWGDQPIPGTKLHIGTQPTLPVEKARLSTADAFPFDQNHRSAHTNDKLDDLSTKYKARSVTVAFSSPLVEPSEPRKSGHEDEHVWEDESELDLADLPEHGVDTRDFSSPGNARPNFLRQGRKASRRFSIGNKMFTPRPISRIDENDEVSLLKVNSSSNSKEQMALSTPQPLRDVPGTLSMPPTADRCSSVGFHLSPLPEFTISADESMNLDVEYVAKRRGLLSLQDVEDKFSLAIKELVQNITDVEPYEPYWEYIRKLQLRDRKLLTLHMLDDFCSRIEELDVANNELGQANGAPESIRVLNISNNCLSGLTAWGHLYNLQYLDVSGNSIDSLRGFSSLIHLRELNVENNRIELLEGVHALNGLIKLNVGRNNIKRLDFEDSDL